MRHQYVAEAFASLCPNTHPTNAPPGGPLAEPPDAGYFSLQDIVTTGLEGGYEWFLVSDYRYDAIGDLAHPWVMLREQGEPASVYRLWAGTVRMGLEKWIAFRIERGDGLHSILHNLEDMDLNDCDAVLQFATWGELRYG